MDEGEQQAVISALSRAIDLTDLRPITLVKSYDLRASQLAREFSRNAENEKKLLSEPAIALFNRATTEAATYAIEVSTRLPTFTPVVFSELLQKQNSIDKIVVEVLGELKKLRETAEANNPEGDMSAFEKRYCVAISHRNDEIELFGLEAPSRIRRQNLTIAYVTLSMSRKETPAKTSKGEKAVTHIEELARWISSSAGRIEPDKLASQLDSFILYDVKELRTDPTMILNLKRMFKDIKLDVSNLLTTQWLSILGNSCNVILASSPRLLIRGGAGSGKTTLLQWLTVNSGSHRFEGQLEFLNSTIPIFIRLREYSTKDLPSPRNLIAAGAPELADSIPADWPDHLLSSGRGLVLIDGVDELDLVKRDEVRKWIRSLVKNYPKCRYILTSRPTAVEEDWLSTEGFGEAELLPISRSDTDNLVDHWHEAIGAQSPNRETPDELRQIAIQLKKQLRQNKPLADIATTPLLCAMVCALHYQRGQQLPPNRVALYEAGIRMLLDQRDRVRGIGSLSLPTLTEDQKRTFLENLAYWMLRNKLTTCARKDLVDELARTTRVVQGLPIDATPERVAELLIQRSGIIRSPGEDQIDFVHKTFQEFLSARAIIDAGDLNFLVSEAHIDQWHETIILAAGIAPLRQRDEFLKAIMQRAERDSRQRQQLLLLAVACLETATSLSPEVEEVLDSKLRQVIPPNNMTEARSLKAAGNLAIPLLRRKPSYNARQAAACVRALTMIGGSGAIQSLETYATEKRWTVVRELVSAFTSFNSEEYTDKVLANSPLRDGVLYLESPSGLQYLPKLKNLRFLNASNFKDTDLEKISKLSKLEGLSVQISNSAKSLNPLRSLTNLTYLALFGLRGIESLEPLSALKNLGSIYLYRLEKCKDLDPILELKEVESLQVVSNDIAIGRRKKLTPTIATFNVDNGLISDFSIFKGLKNLTHLNCACDPASENLNELSSNKKIETLQLNLRGRNFDLGWIGELAELDILSLRASGATLDSIPLEKLQKLTSLTLQGFPISMEKLLPNAKALKRLYIGNCSMEEQFPYIQKLESIEILQLQNVTGLRDCRNISKLPNLHWIAIGGCKDVDPSSITHPTATLHLT